MSKQQEAMRLALEALVRASSYYDTYAEIAALEAALAEPCPCGDRAAARCPGEWEPGCDLGNNPKYAKRVEMTPKELAASIKRGEKWKVAEPGSLMIAAQQFLEWNRAQSPPPVTVGFELGVFEAVKKAYPFPPQRKPLLAVDLRALYDQHAACQEEGPETSGWWDFARAIERAHGIT